MLNLYTESAFQVKPTNSTKRIELSIPRGNGTYDRSKFSKKPVRSDQLATDDKSYAAEYLASASSVFCRQSSSYPRSFLWRVLGKQRLLEVLNADFARSERDQEAAVVLAFEFQDKISPRGISICDSGKKDDFYIFVLTEANEVFEIRLQTNYFQDPSSIPRDTKSWCSAIRASSLSIDRAFYIHAANPHDIFVSFASGKVQHWRRSEEQRQWIHVNYDDKSWGSSLLSIVSRKAFPDYDFDGMRLAYNTAYAMARHGQYLFTACLNHTLRIWHLESGRLVDTRDLLDVARDPQDPQDRIRLSPAEPGYLQFLEGGWNKNEHILMTYSPLNGGQVKYWNVRGSYADEPDLFSIEDMTSGADLHLPDPDPNATSHWSLAGLRTMWEKQTKLWRVWALWRNNNFHKAYSLAFDYNDKMKGAWRDDWVAVKTISARARGPDFVLSDVQDITSKWLEYILFPGRYSNAVVETALAQYSAAADIRISSHDRVKPLQERLSLLVASQASLRKSDDSTIDYERFAIETDQQWRQLWRTLESINEGRYAPLALACDPATNMVWLTMADLCCAIRECNNLELLQTNTADSLNDYQRLTHVQWHYREGHKPVFTAKEAKAPATFLSAAQKFFNSFPPELTADFLQTLQEDLYTESEIETPTRIVNFFNEIDFANAVPDNVEKEFLKDLSSIGGLEAISNDTYTTLLKYMYEHHRRPGKPSHIKTELGVQLVSSALLDEMVDVRGVLLSMIAVVVFVDESEHFDTPRFFEQLVANLESLERTLWLATHNRQSLPAATEDVSTSILQDIHGQSLRVPSSDGHPMPFLLMQHLRDILDFVPGDLEAGADSAAVFFQCNLLKHGETQFASDFLKFQPSTKWSIYVKGRLSLALGNYKEAGLYFRDASHTLATGRALGRLEEVSAGLLTEEEAACFNSGLPKYFAHILSLFEGQQASSEAIDFAHLALKALAPDKKEPSSNFKQNILLRLFSAQLQCSKFDEAYQTLVQFTDPILQKASTIDLVDTMLNASSSLSDTAGVVRKLQQLPLLDYPHLATQVDNHLAFLAKKQTSIPSAGGLWLSSSTVDYLSILHALRLSRKDFRGAVTVLFDRLRIIQKSGRARSDPQATSLRHALLALMNAMTCVPEDEAYILADSGDDPRIGGLGLKRARDQASSNQGPIRKRQRVIVTLEDLRKEYQKVLDRCSRIERGDFEFGGDDEEAEEDYEAEEETITNGDHMRLQIDKNGTQMSGALQLSNADAMQLT
ncbi:hypothetical protein H2198_002605 [Neophaeococcomyces mojaviensis]|uniref:Uncharacterized protein n=1 Tax=Neophaeococcomyces mojaviensis TaxID=3383035 RepID=A0ACC3ADU5_9EURO|nr:hypothetical protein H2198_002605 [Knufia sp. JES_112]